MKIFPKSFELIPGVVFVTDSPDLSVVFLP